MGFTLIVFLVSLSTLAIFNVPVAAHTDERHSFSRQPDSPQPSPPPISLADLPTICIHCVLDPNDANTIKPGPCATPLVNGSHKCYAFLENGACPVGTQTCSDVCPNATRPTGASSIYTIHVPYTQKSYEVEVGTAVVFQPSDGLPHTICSGSPNTTNISAYHSGDGKFYSGLLPTSSYYWLMENSVGRFNFYDSLGGGRKSTIVVRPPKEMRPRPLRLYLPVPYSQLSQSDLTNVTETVSHEIEDLLNVSDAGTAVFNVSFSSSASGYLAIDVQLDTSNETQLLANSTSVIVVALASGRYVASTSDVPSSDKDVTGGDPSLVGPILGSCLAAAVVVWVIFMIHRKRTSSDSVHLASASKAIRLEEIVLDEDGNSSGHHVEGAALLLDAQGFAPIHYAVIEGNRARVYELLSANAMPRTSPAPAPKSATHGIVVSPFSASTDSEPSPPSMPSPGTGVSVSPAPPTTAATTGPRLVDVADARGNTPLHLAAQLGDLTMCQLLLHYGANVTAVNVEGRTAVHVACVEGVDGPVLQALLAAGANPDAVDSEGSTALSFACMFGRGDLSGLLLDAGCDPNIDDAHGVSPLIAAVRRGHSDIVRQLLATPPLLPNNKDAQGWTALHWAAAVGECNGLHWLLSHRRVRLAVINSKDETPLHLAAREGNVQVIKMLAETRRAELVRMLIPALNVDGQTAMDYAAERDQAECAALMHRLLLEGPLAGLPTLDPGEVFPDPFDFTDPVSGFLATTPHPIAPAPVITIAPVPFVRPPPVTVTLPLSRALPALPLAPRQIVAPIPSVARPFLTVPPPAPAASETSDSGVDEQLVISDPSGVSPDGPAPSAGDGSPPSPSPLAAATDAGDGMADGGGDLTPEERVADRLELKRQYMRDKRREHKVLELQWEDKVAELEQTNRKLMAELAAQRAEAKRLRGQMSARSSRPATRPPQAAQPTLSYAPSSSSYYHHGHAQSDAQGPAVVLESSFPLASDLTYSDTHCRPALPGRHLSSGSLIVTARGPLGPAPGYPSTLAYDAADYGGTPSYGAYGAPAHSVSAYDLSLMDSFALHQE